MSNLVVVLPLKEGAHERVRALLAEGPPFSDLAAHLLQEAFEPWRPLLEGEPRIAREEYAWERASG